MTALVVMAYGTPASRDEVAAYYTDIRRGRPPSPGQLADLVARYDAIGGLSPLRAITEAQRDVLARHWDGPVVLGYKHASPTIEEAVASVGADAAGLVLAPHYADASIGEYARRAGVPTLPEWHLLPEYVGFLAAALARTDPAHEVVFTAHSLPIDAAGDYPRRLRETAAAVAEKAGLARWSTAWQSAGRTAAAWLGPDIREVVEGTDAPGIVVCPCGFVADHLEVLYDLDVEAAAVARAAGREFARTPSLNADETVLAALARLVRDRIVRGSGG